MLSKILLEELNEILLKDKERLERDLADIAQKKGEKYQPEYEEAGNSDDDNSLELTNFADQVELASNLQNELEDVNKALSAIKSNTYGTCKYCNKAIDEKRLRARPTSSSCISCKKALTQEL